MQLPQAGKRIKTQQEYEQRLKVHDKWGARFKAAVDSENYNRLVDAQPILRFLNKEFKHIREWEKAHEIYRYPAFKVGKVTYQAI